MRMQFQHLEIQCLVLHSSEYILSEAMKKHAHNIYESVQCWKLTFFLSSKSWFWLLYTFNFTEKVQLVRMHAYILRCVSTRFFKLYPTCFFFLVAVTSCMCLFFMFLSVLLHFAIKYFLLISQIYVLATSSPYFIASYLVFCANAIFWLWVVTTLTAPS